MGSTQLVGIIGTKEEKLRTIKIINYIFNVERYCNLLINDEFIVDDNKKYKINTKEVNEKIEEIQSRSNRLNFIFVDISSTKAYEEILGNKSLDCLVDLRTGEIDNTFHEKDSILYRKLKRNGIAIVSSDEKKSIDEFSMLQNRIIITYGMDMKSTMTTSSVPFRDETTLICCLQRGITTFNGDEIEPMEFPIKFYYLEKINTITILSVIILCLRYDIAVENLQELLSKYK